MGIERGGTYAIGGELVVHRMAYGAMRLAPNFTRPGIDMGAEATTVLRRVVALGVDLIDTAEYYPGNEAQIAAALAPYPAQLTIATKCGLAAEISPEGQRRLVMRGSPAQVRAAIEGSLKRLGVDCIALYQLHRIDPAVPIEETMGEFARLRDEGKLRHVGLSEVSVEEIERARTVMPVATVQNRYNVVERFHEPVLRHCEAEGIGFLPFFPVGAASLTRPDGPLAALATAHGATPSQIALAWLLHRSPVLMPIAGTTSIAHLEENVAACDIVLSDADMAGLDALADYGPLAPP